MIFGLKLRSASGEVETFRATYDHPWFTTARTWVETKDLKVGDLIETATGEDFRLISIKLSGKTEQTYNLTVADLHTFMIGENHIVVHNSEICGVIQNKKLLNHMKNLYKQGTVGSGSTADAIRHELATGGTVGGKRHLQKGEDAIRGLTDLANNRTLSPYDRQIASDMLADLKSAFAGN